MTPLADALISYKALEVFAILICLLLAGIGVCFMLPGANQDIDDE